MKLSTKEALAERAAARHRARVLKTAANRVAAGLHGPEGAPPQDFLQSCADAGFASRLAPPFHEDVVRLTETGRLLWGPAGARGPQPGDALAEELAAIVGEEARMDALGDEGRRTLQDREPGRMEAFARRTCAPLVESGLVAFLGDHERESALKTYAALYAEDHPGTGGPGILTVEVTPDGVHIATGKDAEAVARRYEASLEEGGPPSAFTTDTDRKASLCPVCGGQHSDPSLLN